jgi:hypothetical protein
VSFLLLLALNSAAADAADPGRGCHQLPSNIHVGDDLHAAVTRLLHKSKTFSAQCAAIAAANVRVSVVVTLDIRDPLVRARATIARFEDGRLLAMIEVPPAVDYAELLPHEFEHVIEQIEGIDLAALARSGDARIVATGDGAFETARAKAAGLAAAREFYGEANAALGAAFRGVGRMWRAVCSRSADTVIRIRAGAHKEF